MHFGDAFAFLGNLSAERQRAVFADQRSSPILRGAAALLIAGHRDLALDDKVNWLIDCWESAPLDVRRYILEALGQCASPRSIAFLREKLSDREVLLDAINALANLKIQDILPVCQEFARSGTESECRSALKALATLGTPSSTAVLEAALHSSPSKSCRQWAAYLLALNGIRTGESVLEGQLASLEPLRVESQESVSQGNPSIDPDYLLVAIALSGISNRNGVLAMQRLLDILEKDHNITAQHAMNMTIGMLGMRAPTSCEKWKAALQEWIDERPGLQSSS